MSEEKVNVCLVSGAPAVGKSTLAKNLIELVSSEVIVADMDVLRRMYRKTTSNDPNHILNKSFFEMNIPEYIAQIHEFVPDALSALITGAQQTNRKSIIVLGAHVLPGTLDKIIDPPLEITQYILNINDEQEYKNRFMGSDKTHPTRRFSSHKDAYLQFNKAQEYQNALLYLAEKLGIPIVESDEMAAQTILRAMQAKSAHLIIVKRQNHEQTTGKDL
ncbi:MAG: hypothetical protein FWE45_04975 [Firmicutes bacterium]|nr:hypothetical protein [Bacillota bacterium]